MRGDPEVHRWSVSAHDLHDMNELKARDIIVKCFIEAQKETFQRASERLGARTDPDSIQKSMTASVRMVFKEAGHDFDHPTSESLEKVVDRLGRAALSWGTPEDIIHHHKQQIDKVLKRLHASRDAP